MMPVSLLICMIKWWARRVSNPQPKDYESSALTIELLAHKLVNKLVNRLAAAVLMSTTTGTPRTASMITARAIESLRSTVRLALLLSRFDCFI